MLRSCDAGEYCRVRSSRFGDAWARCARQGLALPMVDPRLHFGGGACDAVSGGKLGQDVAVHSGLACCADSCAADCADGNNARADGSDRTDANAEGTYARTHYS